MKSGLKSAETWNKDLDPKMGIEEREQDIERTREIQANALREAGRILENLPCIRHDGKQSSEYIKAGLRAGYMAILEARKKLCKH